MKIKATSTIGKADMGYRWNASVEANDDQLVRLAEYGVIWLMQRNTSVDKTLGLKVKSTGKRGGEVWVSTGKTRSDVEFDGEVAKDLASDLSIMEGADGFKMEAKVDVIAYEGETGGPAYKRSVQEIAKLVGMGILTKDQGEKATKEILAKAGVTE